MTRLAYALATWLAAPFAVVRLHSAAQIHPLVRFFLSLDNDRSGPRSGARSLRTGARPLDAGKQQARHRRADIPRVLWTQIQYST